MAVQTLRPNASAVGGTGLTVVGAASHEVAQSDNVDSSYSEWAAATNPTLTLEVGTFTLPAYAQVRQVTPRVRLALATAGTRPFSFRPQIAGVGWFGPLTQVSPTTTISTYTGGAATSGPSGEFTQANIDALQVLVQANTVGSVPIGRAYEVFLDVEYNMAPTATVTAPTGSIGTPKPAVTWTYADTEGDPQERFRVKVFTQAQVDAVGFNPETSAAAYDSGEVLSNATTHTLTSPLTDGVIHRAYVKVGDLTPTGFPARYGAWAQGPQFTPTDTLLATPGLAAVAQPTSARVLVTVTNQDNLLSQNNASLETDVTGWTSALNANLTRSTAWSAHGAASLQLSSVAAGDMEARTATGLTGIPVVPGQQMTILATSRAATVARSFRIGVDFYNAAGTIIGSTTYNTAIANSTSVNTQGSLTLTTPTGAAFATVRLRVLATAGAAELHRFDKISIAQGGTTIWYAGGVTSRTVDVQRSIDGGLTWWRVRGLTATVLPDTGVLSVYDQEAPRSIPIIYRARTSGLRAGVAAASNWSSSVGPVTLDHDGNSWLKSPTDPAFNLAVHHATLEFASVSKEDISVFEPEGRKYPLVLGGTIRAESFDGLELFFRNDANYVAFEQLRARQEPVLFQTGYGDGAAEQYWVRLGPERRTIRLTHDDMQVTQFRRVSVGAVEVAPPNEEIYGAPGESPFILDESVLS